MFVTPSLPLSLIVPVSVVISGSGSPGPQFNQALIVGSSTVLSASTRLQQYTSLAGMTQAGFSVTSPEYLAATIYFSNNSNGYLWIGVQILTALQTVAINAAGTGYTVGDVCTVAGGTGGTVQVTAATGGVPSAVSIVAQGSGYTIATGEATTGGTGSGLTINVTEIGESPLQAMTACRNAQPAWYACMFVGPTGISVVETTGTASAASKALTVALGTSIAIGQYVTGTGLAVGTYITAGSGTSWTLSQATTASLSSTAVTFYAAFADSDHAALAGFIQAATPPSLYFLTSGEAAILSTTPVSTTATAIIATTSLTVAFATGIVTGQLVTGAGIAPGSTVTNISGTTITISAATTAALSNTTVTFSGNLFATLQAASYSRTWMQYSTTQSGAFPNNIYASAGPMGLAMGLNTGAAGSYFTLALKNIVGVGYEPLTVSQFTTICGPTNRSSTGLNGNALVDFANNSYIILENGTMASGAFFDQILFVDVLASQVQYNAMNLLTSVPALPITNSGVQQMANVIGQACLNLQAIGFIANAGTWQGPTIGPYTAGTAFPKGWNVYVGTLTQAQRPARQLPPFNVLVIQAEAGQSLVVQINVQP